ncbi:hypothetical protein [Streptosporangium sp. NPDC049644]|uniref:hypothetical protein n=1 Tax=Streptosporangium sp. NPDC049644 TaxID=3155507 RepID=UPI003444655A
MSEAVSGKSDPNERNYKPIAFVLVLLGAIFMVMPIRHVVIEVNEFGLRQLLVQVLILVGLPVAGALVGALLRFQGMGGSFFGIALGVFVSSLLLMALLAYWAYYSLIWR